MILAAIGVGGPKRLSDLWTARLGLIMISASTVGEGFLIAMATRQEIPDDLYELAEVESAGPGRRSGESHCR